MAKMRNGGAKDPEDVPQEKDVSLSGLMYSIHDKPPWAISLVMGLQHYLIMFGSTSLIPLIVTSRMCMRPDDVVRSYIISTIFFVSGLATVLQSTLGVR